MNIPDVLRYEADFAAAPIGTRVEFFGSRVCHLEDFFEKVKQNLWVSKILLPGHEGWGDDAMAFAIKEGGRKVFRWGLVDEEVVP